MRFFNLSARSSRAYLRASITCLALGAAWLTSSGFRPAPGASPAAAHSALLPDTVARQLRGRVFDAYTQEPLPTASLWLKRLALATQSDEQGYFTFDLTAEQLATTPVDTLQIQVRAFRPQALPVAFLERPADSLLRLLVQRDSVVTQPKPLPALPRREVRRLGKTSSLPRPQQGPH
ncbi:hypothetical protein GCM10027048_08790 [Hymenobacter coalescens]